MKESADSDILGKFCPLKMNLDFFFIKNFISHRDKFLPGECFPLFPVNDHDTKFLEGGRKAFPSLTSGRTCLEVALC